MKREEKKKKNTQSKQHKRLHISMTKIVRAKSNFMSWQLHHWNGQLANYAISLSNWEFIVFRKVRKFEGLGTVFSCRIMNIIMLHLWNKHLQMSEKFTFYSWKLVHRSHRFPQLVLKCNADSNIWGLVKLFSSFLQLIFSYFPFDNLINTGSFSVVVSIAQRKWSHFEVNMVK